MTSWQFQRTNSVHPFRHSFIIKALLCYAFIQIILLLFINLPFTSDSLFYYEQASNCIVHNTFYPAQHNLYDNYIVAPLYINFISFLLRIYHNPLIIRIANILLNLLQALLVYAVTQSLFHNERQSRIALLLYIVFLTNLGIIFYNYSELLFGVLLLLSFYLYLQDTFLSTLNSGIVLALACNTRPIGLALLISISAISVFVFIQEKHISPRILPAIGSFFFTLLVIGGITKQNTGYFVPLPTNGSCNILIGANNDATGAYNDCVFQPGKSGYSNDLKSFTFLEKEKFFRDAALKWISQHPLRWLELIPAKLFHLFGRDDWAISALINTNQWNIYTIAKLLKEHRNQEIFAGESIAFVIAFIGLFVLHHLYYYTLIGMMVYQFRYYKRNRLNSAISQNMIIYIFVLVGIFITLCSVGAPRYQYSFIIFLIPTITPMIDNILQKRNLN